MAGASWPGRFSWLAEEKEVHPVAAMEKKSSPQLEPVPEATRVTVTILGGRYQLKGTEPEEYLASLAQKLDERLNRMSERYPHLAPSRVTMLVALNLLDELSKLQREYEELVRLIRDGGNE